MGTAGSDQRPRSRRSGSERSKRSSSVDRFVGRAKEIAALTGALPATRPTGAVLWTVVGPAGIGKTRLVQELAHVAVGSGHRVVWGQCWDEAGTPPYWPWTQVIRQLRGNPIGVDLGSFVQPDAGPVDRFALFDATAVELRAAAAEVPLVVVLDDLHHSDALSLMLTRFVLAHLSDAPLLVVGAYRAYEAAARSDIIGHLAALRDDANELNLSGLDLDGVRELVGDTLRADDVHTLTGGNPLFVEQIVRSAECPVAGTPSASDASAGHATLLSAVTARLIAVDAEVLELLAGLAVLGPHATGAAAAALLGRDVDVLERVAGRAADAGLLGPEPWSLSHQLVADAIMGLVADDRLAAWHFTAAGLDGAGGSSPAERAFHLCRAGGEHWEAAVEACCEAAEVASESFAHADAVAHYERAVGLIDDHAGGPEVAFDVTFAMAAALERSGRRLDAEATYGRAYVHARRSGNAESVARAAARHGISFYADEHLHRARADECRAALEVCPGDSALRVRLLANLAASHIAAAGSARLADEAVRIGRRIGDAEALGIALVAQQVTDLGPATLHRRLRTSREIIALAEMCGESDLAIRGRFLLKNALLEAGEVRELDAELLNQDRLVNDTADVRFARHSLWFRCMRASFDGHAAQVESLATRCLEISQQLQDPDGFGVYTGQYGVALWMQGRLVELEPVYLDLMQTEPDAPLWPAVLGWIWLGQRRIEAARGMLDRVPPPKELPSGMHQLLSLYTIADLTVAVGDDTLVGDMWEALLPYADRVVPIAMGAACFGVIARPLGQLALRMGHVDEGIAHLERAVQITARMGARPWLVDAQLALAEALLDAGRADDRRLSQLVREASGTVSSLDLAVFSDRVTTLADRVEAMRIATQVPTSAASHARTHSAQHRALARVSVLGTFDVRAVDGSSPRWTSRKARSLLKILVARRGSPMAREQLMDLLWCDAHPDDVANRMSVAVSTVRRALDPGRTLPVDALVRADGGSLRLMFDVVDVDVEAFLRHGQAAIDSHRRRDPDALSMLRAALAEYRGEALPDEPYEPWAQALRSSVSATYATLLRATAERAVVLGDSLLASDTMRQLVELDPYDESAHLGLVTALRSLGAHGQAQAAVRCYVQRMAELGLDVETSAAAR